MKHLFTLTLVSILAAGCTHTARITNAKKFTPAPVQLAHPVTVGFTSIGNDRLLDAAVREIKANPAIADAKEDYKPGSAFRPQFVCQLSRDAKFKASGQNFFITFPGFMVFTHALVGYKYTADITTHSALMDSESKPVNQVDIHTPLEFRHCSFARGATTGCLGWLVPGYGAAAIIPGAIFAGSYDKRATSEFMEKAEETYAKYVAGKVIEQMSQAGSGLSINTLIDTTDPALSAEEMDDAFGALPAGEYAVYVMSVKEKFIGQPSVSIRKLTQDAQDTLNAMSRTGLVPDETSAGDLLTEFGISADRFAGNLGEIEVFTQMEDRIVPLQKKQERTGLTL